MGLRHGWSCMCVSFPCSVTTSKALCFSVATRGPSGASTEHYSLVLFLFLLSNLKLA